jgi:hypothetical protein
MLIGGFLSLLGILIFDSAAHAQAGTINAGWDAVAKLSKYHGTYSVTVPIAGNYQLTIDYGILTGGIFTPAANPHTIGPAVTLPNVLTGAGSFSFAPPGVNLGNDVALGKIQHIRMRVEQKTGLIWNTIITAYNTLP